jgi:hypothetical protein
MRKYIISSILAIVLVIILLVNTTYATVGGPTTIFDLKYDQKTSSVYYTEQSYSGKGCPPILKSLSYLTGVSKTIYSCDDEISGTVGQSQKIYSYTSTFYSLTHINLRKNNITVSIDGGVVENYPNTTEKAKINFVAQVLQNNTNIIKLALSGCSLEQPYVIDGYSIPGVKDKILLLISGVSDCWEGGYIFERLVLVPGIQVSDSSVVSSYKDISPMVPNEGSVIAYPAKPNIIDSSPDTQEPLIDKDVREQLVDNNININQIVIFILSVILSLVIGIVIGRISRKNSGQPIVQ